MDEIENKQNLNGKGPWWKPGMEIMSEVSTWIIVPIVLALVFGKMLDAHYGTKPVIFLSLAGLGFLVTCFGMWRVMKNYLSRPESGSRQGSGKNNKDKNL